jgi:hypothetical protein
MFLKAREFSSLALLINYTPDVGAWNEQGE